LDGGRLRHGLKIEAENRQNALKNARQGWAEQRCIG
jgi:hypothetical protein